MRQLAFGKTQLKLKLLINPNYYRSGASEASEAAILQNKTHSADKG